MNIAVTEGFGLQSGGGIFDASSHDPFRKIPVVAPGELERPGSIRSFCSAADTAQTAASAAPAYHRIKRTARSVERQAAVDAVDALGLPLAPLAVKRGVRTINPDRLKHAQHIPKCPKISRYGTDTFKSSFEVVYAPVPVQSFPETEIPAPQEQSAAVRVKTTGAAAKSKTKAASVSSRLVAPLPAAAAAMKPQPAQLTHPAQPAHMPRPAARGKSLRRPSVRRTGTQLDMCAPQPAAAKAAASAAPRSTRITDMFEQAVAEASHFIDIKIAQEKEQRRLRRQRMMFAGGGAAACVVLLLAFYVQTPGLQMRLAGIRTGVRAAVPDIGAAGLSYQGVRIQNDKRIITLKDSVGRQYSFIQQPTNWNEQEMVKYASPAAAGGDAAVRSADLTTAGIRLYRTGNKVMWIKDGTWYQFVGNEALSDAQLKELARNS